MLLVMTVRAEMMMIKTGESAALECEGAWKYCEWKHHEQVRAVHYGKLRIQAEIHFWS